MSLLWRFLFSLEWRTVLCLGTLLPVCWKTQTFTFWWIHCCTQMCIHVKYPRTFVSFVTFLTRRSQTPVDVLGEVLVCVHRELLQRPRVRGRAVRRIWNHKPFHGNWTISNISHIMMFGKNVPLFPDVSDGDQTKSTQTTQWSIQKGIGFFRVITVKYINLESFWNMENVIEWILWCLNIITILMVCCISNCACTYTQYTLYCVESICKVANYVFSSMYKCTGELIHLHKSWRLGGCAVTTEGTSG